MQRTPLTDHAHLLVGPYATCARYLLEVAPSCAVPTCGNAIAVWGVPEGHHEVSFAWLFGDGDDLDCLCEEIAGQGAPLVCPMDRLEQVARHFPEASSGMDHLYAHAGPGAVDAPPPDWIPGRPDAVAPSLAERLPPPAIWSPGRFRYAGVQVDGVLVAVCEATVDDGDHAVVQQVFTDPAHRGRGLARQLLTRVVAQLYAEGRTPLYVADASNTASTALAEAVGFTLSERLGTVTGST